MICTVFLRTREGPRVGDAGSPSAFYILVTSNYLGSIPTESENENPVLLTGHGSHFSIGKCATNCQNLPNFAKNCQHVLCH